MSRAPRIDRNRRRITDPVGVPPERRIPEDRTADALERIADVLEWQRARAERGNPSGGPR